MPRDRTLSRTLRPKTEPDPLMHVDIVLSIYNQEAIVERILGGIFDSTVTPFALILVFDGCTDSTRPIAERFLARAKASVPFTVRILEAPNVYETRANNAGFRESASDYVVTLQDDMLILERGWEVRLTYPIRAYDSVFAVTGRMAMDIMPLQEEDTLTYERIASRETFSLPRDRFSVRDIINRGPVAFKGSSLRELGYLDETYAPSDLDDADIVLRAWRDRGLVCGAFWIDYLSKPEWSKAKAADSTMHAGAGQRRNARLLLKTHWTYLEDSQKHSADILILPDAIDYPIGFDREALKRSIGRSSRAFVSGRFAFHARRAIHTAKRRVGSLARILSMRPHS